jgi:septum site-determining protein MinD
MLSSDDIIELLAIDLVGIVPEDENVVISTNRGTPIVTDPRSRAGMAFMNIARRLNGETVPLLNLDLKANIFDRMAKMIKVGGK